jgi:hypothetical protein
MPQGPAPAGSSRDSKAAAAPEHGPPASRAPTRERGDTIALLALLLAAFAVISAFMYIAGRNAESDRSSGVEVPPPAPKSTWK